MRSSQRVQSNYRGATMTDRNRSFSAAFGIVVAPIAVAALTAITLMFLLAAAPLAVADPAPLGENQGCPAATREQALALGDQLRKDGVYQRAGKCYEAAREYTLANQTFLAALEPEGKATAQQLSGERDQAKTLLHQVQQAFSSKH
jgi:hypothetical protein